MSDDSRQELDRIDFEATRLSIPTALAANIAVSSCITDDIPSVFGWRWEKEFINRRRMLHERYNERLTDLMTLAVRWFIYSKYHTFLWLKTYHESEGDIPDRFNFGTPDEYADSEGWAWGTYNQLSNLKQPLELLQDLSFSEMPKANYILDALSLFWFFEAASYFSNNPKKALDILFEVSNACELASGVYMWDESREHFDIESEIETTKLMSVLGKRGANARHAETRSMREFAKKHWRENIDPELSTPKAADILIRVVPLSHRKLEEIIRKIKNQDKKD